MALSFRTPQLLGLVDRIRAGERAAADELFRRSGARLERLARKMLRGFPDVRRWEQTPDVVQKASMRLLRALREVRPYSTRHFFALAGKHIRYELLSLKEHYRALNEKHHSDGVAAGSGTPAHEPADSAPGPDELEEWCAFHRQIDALPEEERAAVDLHFYQGPSKAEAAEILGVDARTVQRRWNAALLRLRRDDKPGP
jgi:RNA polymerase sigma-70 factor (ECF subfamily)